MTAFERARDGEYDAWLDAVEGGEGYYLECPNGHGSLPPRRACPRCGERDLEETTLPRSGTVETFTVVSVATPDFSEDVPYVTAIASFGPVSITGLLRGVDHDAVETGLPVGIDVETTETTGNRAVAFRPR